jgi:gamma-glutamyltranspeptidase / glutathione hydrolase
MVSSCHYLATQAGVRVLEAGGNATQPGVCVLEAGGNATQAGVCVLEAGGNAIDAGVAAGIAPNVLERDLTHFGGLAPVVIFRPGMSEPETLDGPGPWHVRTETLDGPGPWHVRTETLDGPGHSGRTARTWQRTASSSVTTCQPAYIAASHPTRQTPGVTALARHGKLSLGPVLAPATDLATNGFPVNRVNPRLGDSIQSAAPLLRQWPTRVAVCLRDGRPPEVGELVVQTELARHAMSLDPRRDPATVGW